MILHQEVAYFVFEPLFCAAFCNFVVKGAMKIKFLLNIFPSVCYSPRPHVDYLGERGEKAEGTGGKGEKQGRKEREEEPSYPCTVRTLPMEGEEGGVAASLIIPVGEPWDGGDVDGTARLTATASSVSPWQSQKGKQHYQIIHSFSFILFNPVYISIDN